jgi:hypothetical protein
MLPIGSGNTLGNLGAAAGTFPAPPVFRTLGDIGNRGEPTAPYIGALGPRSVTGPGRGSPAGGLPVQAREAPSLMLTRERLQRALDDHPGLAATLARNRSAEIGPTASPEKRAWYDALVLDRAAARGEPLDYTLTNSAYFPPTTTGYRGPVGNYATDPALFAGANPANFATGNASRDPATGRQVGFGGGPQTSSIGSGSNPERGGVERQDLPYARAVGYTGPDTTPIGVVPGAPLGMDATDLTSGGWNTTVSADAGAPGGAGYVNPGRVAQGASTDPAELVRKDEESKFNLARLLAGFDFKPATPAKAAPLGFGTASPFKFAPVGQRR